MCLHHCIQLLLLGIAFVNASTAWFYNKGVGYTAPFEVGCASFTNEYDPYTGHFTYRCNPDVQKKNYLSIPNGHSNDKESSEDEDLTPNGLQTSGRSRMTNSKPRYQSFNSGRSQTNNKKNNKPERPTNIHNKPMRPSNSGRNRCPPGQIFQSELDICIDYPLGPPLPPRRPNNSKQTKFDLMLADAPVRSTAESQKTPDFGTILSVRKYDIKNRCKPNEILVSELDICLPRNNCFPYGTAC